jgi:alcohol dehydrogenase class IV
VTGASGYDAIGSCLDVLWRPDVPSTADSAREGLEMLWGVLPSMLDDRLDVAARETAFLGARAAGRASDAGEPGLYRRLSWELAALRSRSPAELSGWLLPTVAELQAAARPQGAVGDLADQPVPDALRDLGKRLGLVTDPVTLGYDADDLARALARVTTR